MAGFLNYGPDTHEQFLKLYNPQYDGHAAKVGFRSGDLVTGISFCRAKVDKNKKKPEPTPEEVEGKCTNQPYEHPEVVKKLKKITLRTTDEEWKRYAQSCESLLPDQPITFRVKRFVPDDVDVSSLAATPQEQPEQQPSSGLDQPDQHDHAHDHAHHQHDHDHSRSDL